ncbi:MAG: DEAD/DEAH box helicase family protein [Deltaproteobacteria bacterium]|nr:DEAD/DEAH box helicase family protein [Deltaproteobacteria bacterium]
MNKRAKIPYTKGQLVWSPADPALGVGVITKIEAQRIWVRFVRLQEQRAYTTRGVEHVILHYEIGHGERVRTREGIECKVEKKIGVTPEGLHVYALEDGSEAVENELIPEIRDVGAKERLATLNLVHPQVVRARMQGLALSRFGKNAGDAAILGTRVQWLPHQVDVATRAIASDRIRLLLADEVGLGKTVEATLIYAGLRALNRANRVLILTPDALCIQWLGEIYRKAHELLVLLDEERIDDALQDFPDLSPFEAHQRIVASLDQVAADPKLMQQAAAASWDLVIIDEAHHLRWRPGGGGNPAYHLVESLSRQTQHLLLLTATPMALDPAEYHALLRLLDNTRFDNPEDFNATAKRIAIIREVGQALVKATSEQTALTKNIIKQAKELLADDTDDSAAFKKFLSLDATTALRADAAQDILGLLRERHAIADYVVRNRRGPVGGLPERHAETFALTATSVQDVLINVGESVMLELVQTIAEPRERYTNLGELLRALWATPRALADILQPISPELVNELLPYIKQVTESPRDEQGLPTGDARLRWLVEIIRQQDENEKLLVFVESSIAVRALRSALEPYCGNDIAVFHRGLAPRDQDRQVAWFRDHQGPPIMLSTEAGGEGRNFQFCHKVVLYDLPWRPATIEQRIGRVDRVGQMQDVRVLVPYFRGGYEAAILRVMQESIGVLDSTVGGIDHALEYVSDRIADLIITGSDASGWKALYNDTHKLVAESRERINNDIDPILDHASFSKDRVNTILALVPEDLEAQTEHFVQSYAGHSRLHVKPQGGQLFSIDGAPSAAGRDDYESGYVATFSRIYALDHEDVEFCSFGHPLLDQATQWATEAHDQSAALAICRGYAKEGAVFLWCFDLDLPDDVPESATFFHKRSFTLALDENGQRVPELEDLLTYSTRRLDRMDPAPLRSSSERWRRLVDGNHSIAEKMANDTVDKIVKRAATQAEEVLNHRERYLLRSQKREQAAVSAKSKNYQIIIERHEKERQTFAKEHQRLLTAVANARPHLVAAVAVRLLRSRDVSA